MNQIRDLFDWADKRPTSSIPVANAVPLVAGPEASVISKEESAKPVHATIQTSLNPPALQADLDRANPNQIRAIKNYRGPMFVQAVPGAGKTETIATKIAYLLTSDAIDPNDRPRPEEILLLSFSDDARRNMQERLKTKLEINQAEKVEVRTYHSLALKVITENPQIKRFAQMGRLIDENEKFELIESIVDDLPRTIAANEGYKPEKYQNLERSPRLYSNNRELIKEVCKHITELKKLDIAPEKFYSTNFKDGGADLPANDYPRFLRNAARNEQVKDFVLQPLVNVGNVSWKKTQQRSHDEKEIEIFLSLLDSISQSDRYKKDGQYIEAPYRKMLRGLKEKAMLDQAQEGGSLRRHFRDLVLKFCALELKTKVSKASASSAGPRAKQTKYAKSDWIEHKYKLEDLALVYEEYIKRLKRHQVHDFDDLVPAVVSEFEHNPELREKYCDKYRYIFGDEFQDTNSAQYHLMSNLAAQSESTRGLSNICVVGDPDQSIFGFQGAASENSYRYIRDFNPMIIVSNQNYRSQGAILEAADHLRGHNYLQSNLGLGSENNKLTAEADHSQYPYQAIKLNDHEDHDSSLAYITDQIETMIDPNGAAIDPSSIAVICRENRDLSEVATALAARKIPHSVEAKTNLLSDKDINLLHRLFQVIAQPNASTDLANTNLTSLLLSPALLKSATYQKNQINTKDIVEACSGYREAILENNFKGSLFDYLKTYSTKLKPVIDLFQDYANRAYHEDFGQLFQKAIRDFGYFNLLYADANKLLDAGKEAEIESVWQRRTKLERISEFAQSIGDRVIERVSNEGQTRGIDKFLYSLSYLEAKDLKIKMNNIGTSSGVKILTAHKSKGKEWDHVMIYKANRGHWGNKSNSNMIKMPPTLGKDPTSIEQAISDEEEERRLFYVAMTRARKTLDIHSYAQSKLGDKRQASSFVNELSSNPNDNCWQSSCHQADPRSQLLAELTGKHDDRPWKEQALTIDLDYLKSRIATVRLNPTNMNLFETCARKFALQELLSGILAIKSFAFGKTIHTALEHYFTELQAIQQQGLNADGKWKANKVPRYDDLKTKLLGYYTQEVQRLGFYAQEQDEILERGHTMLSEYFNKVRYSPDFKNYRFFRDLRIIDTELSMRNRFEHKGVSIPSNGRIDLVVEAQDKDGKKHKIVIDFKTFAPDKDDRTKPGGKLHSQMSLYNLQFRVEEEAGNIDYVPTDYKIYFMQADTRNKFQCKSVKPTNAELEAVKNQALDSYQKIQNLEFPMTDDQAECLDCIFRLACDR